MLARQSITEEAQWVPGATVVGEPCHKVALWVLEASAGNHKAVSRREIYQAVTISAPRAICPEYAVLPGPWDWVLRSSSVDDNFAGGFLIHVKHKRLEGKINN